MSIESIVCSFLLLSGYPCYRDTPIQYLPVDKCLGCFQCEAIISKSAINICAQVFEWTSLLNSLGRVPSCYHEILWWLYV